MYNNIYISLLGRDKYY